MKDSPPVPVNDHPQSAIAAEDQRLQLDKVLRSEVFRNAPGLQKFLEYVTCKTIEGLSHEIKEYAIGTEVFGRSTEYDPKIDTAVRVQAHRLREKLKEYYDGEGATDEILIEVPKGHYVPRFMRRLPAASAESRYPQAARLSPESLESPITDLGKLSSQGRSLGPLGRSVAPPLFWLGAALGGMLLVLGGVLLGSRLGGKGPAERANAASSGKATAGNVEGPLMALWGDFLRSERPPIVAYSNSIFLATESSDLLRLKREEVDNPGVQARTDLAYKLAANPRLLERAGPVFYEDGHTGTGEVMAIYYLTRLFTQAHSSLAVKRSRLVTIDDLTSHDVIFVGSTGENALLAGLPLTQDFVFAGPTRPPTLWRARIANLRLQPGESLAYETERDKTTQALQADYALVSFLPGIKPNRKIVILGGLTTSGTQAAADFATSPSGTAELLAHLGTEGPSSSKRLPPFFQAVLRLEIMKGDILSVKYITGHPIRPAG